MKNWMICVCLNCPTVTFADPIFALHGAKRKGFWRTERNTKDFLSWW